MLKNRNSALNAMRLSIRLVALVAYVSSAPSSTSEVQMISFVCFSIDIQAKFNYMFAIFQFLGDQDSYHGRNLCRSLFHS